MGTSPRRPGLSLLAALATAAAALGGAAASSAQPVPAASAGPATAAAAPRPGSPVPGRTREVRGASAAPVRVDLRQPDGSTIAAVAQGDGPRHWYETASGYSLVRGRDAVWRYATGVDARGQLTAGGPSGAPATTQGAATGATVPSGLARQVRPTADATAPLAAPALALGATGTQRSLVILAQFTDVQESTTASDWNARFFGASSSVRDYYRKASYGRLDLVPATESHGTANDGVVGWLTLNYPHPDFRSTYTATRGSQWLAQEAMKAADPYVDFAAYDTNGDGFVDPFELHVTVIAAGYETAYANGPCGKSIWGHQWALELPFSLDGKQVGRGGYTEFGERHCSSTVNDDRMATIGIMAHELGHDLGWPDLYDIDYSSDGVGRWSLMAAGSWGTNPATPSLVGNSPAYPDAWSRYTQGWTSPTEVVAPSARSLPSAATSATAYRLLPNPGGADWNWGYPVPAAGEYFLVENRTQTGYDVSLPGCGILVYHVDESRPDNSLDSDRLVSVEEADGLRELDTYGGTQGSQGDPFPGASGKKVFDMATNPSSRLVSGALSAAKMVVGSTGCANPATATLSASSAGSFAPLTPARVLDTRTSTPVAASSQVTVQVTGRGGVPDVAGVDAVVLNVTAATPEAPGYATVYPAGAGTPRPTASNLNFTAGAPAVPNLVVAEVGPTGAVSIFNGSPGATHYLADVVGYYRRSGQPMGVRFQPQAPRRILDTRSSSPLGAGATRSLVVTGTASGVPTSATAVVLNVTAARTTDQSYLTVYPAGATRPTTSNLNWPGPVAAIPNLVYTPVGTGGAVQVFNQRGTTDLLVDVVGWFGGSGQLLYHPVTPTRVVDSRTGTGTTAVPFGAGETRQVDLTGGTTPVPEGAIAEVVNTTVTSTTASSFLTAWPADVARPNASNLNWTAGQTVPNLVSTKLAAGGLAEVFNRDGEADVIMDVDGWYGPW